MGGMDPLRSASSRRPTYELRSIKPTLTAGRERLAEAKVAGVGPRKLSIHLSIYCALLHDVQRDQTRRTPKLSRSDAIQGDSLRPSRPHFPKPQVAGSIPAGGAKKDQVDRWIAVAGR